MENNETPKLNLYQRIREVMKDIRYLQKDGDVGNGNYAYKAMSEEKVTESVRVSLIRHGLVIMPIEQDASLVDFERGGKIVSLTTVNTKYKIVNVDNPAEYEILASSGTGTDPQDKGVGKAMTYSYKYMLLRTFAIPTGEDPDKIHNSELEKQQEKEFQAQIKKLRAEIAQMLNSPVFEGDPKSADTLDKLDTLNADQIQRLHPKVTKALLEKTKAA